MRPIPFVLALALVAAAPLGAAAQQTPAASATTPPAAMNSDAGAPAVNGAPTLTPELRAKARAEYLSWSAGTIDWSKYTPEIKAALTSQARTEAAHRLTAMGAPTDFTLVSERTRGSDTLYQFAVKTKNGDVPYRLIIDGTGKVAGIYFGEAG
jgi:hypothetical protein